MVGAESPSEFADGNQSCEQEELSRLNKLCDHVQASVKRLRKTIKDANILVPYFEQVL